MKRIMVVGFTLMMAMLISAPSYAVETKVSGALKYDGVLTIASGEDDDETMTFREMRLRISTLSKITDKITLHTRTDILDKVIDGPETNVGDGTNDAEDANIQIERCYMDIITSVGVVSIGRMEGSTWGTLFGDNADDVDRLKLVSPMTVGAGRLFLAAVAEKVSESMTDQMNDSEKYFLTATYATRTYATGLLFGLYDYGNASDALENLVKYDLFAVVPYFKGMVGPVMLTAEASIATGKSQFKSEATYDFLVANDLIDPTEVFNEQDVEQLSFWIQVGYPMGAANIELGYVYVSGDDLSDNDTNEAASGTGENWEKVFILSSDDWGAEGQLMYNADNVGATMFYLAGSYKVSETLSVNGLVAMATADEVADGADDDFGTELDLGLEMKVMDNLAYNAKFGYLMAGDYFSGDDDLSIYAFYNELVLSF